ncbi:hypothetical protein [Streptomyces lydicus]|uniref:hypothetical protein n=1 Tax=Streptomyces lydicus TaxID=47763 RepID=UPI00378E57FA
MTGWLVRLLALVLPVCGRHRDRGARQAAPVPRHRRHHSRLPRHRSPYARDAVAGGPFMDTRSPVRRYVPRPYISPACHIGTHAACDKGAPGPEVTTVPGVWREACACPCHEGGAPGLHQPAGSFVGAANTVPLGAAA